MLSLPRLRPSRRYELGDRGRYPHAVPFTCISARTVPSPPSLPSWQRSRRPFAGVPTDPDLSNSTSSLRRKVDPGPEGARGVDLPNRARYPSCMPLLGWGRFPLKVSAPAIEARQALYGSRREPSPSPPFRRRHSAYQKVNVARVWWPWSRGRRERGYCQGEWGLWRWAGRPAN